MNRIQIVAQQAIDERPITDFKGKQNPAAGSNIIKDPTLEHVNLVMSKLLDPENKGVLYIAHHTPDPISGLCLSISQVAAISVLVNAKRESLNSEEEQV